MDDALKKGDLNVKRERTEFNDRLKIRVLEKKVERLENWLFWMGWIGKVIAMFGLFWLCQLHLRTFGYLYPAVVIDLALLIGGFSFLAWLWNDARRWV